jgi:hypothetical protein
VWVGMPHDAAHIYPAIGPTRSPELEVRCLPSRAENAFAQFRDRQPRQPGSAQSFCSRMRFAFAMLACLNVVTNVHERDHDTTSYTGSRPCTGKPSERASPSVRYRRKQSDRRTWVRRRLNVSARQRFPPFFLSASMACRQRPRLVGLGMRILVFMI